MKRILLLRTAPFDANVRDYNVQEMGLSKAFCRLGCDVDWYAFSSRGHDNFVFYEYNGHTAKCVEIPRLRIFRWGINLSICNNDFLSQYDIVCCFEQMQLMTYLVARKISNGILYSGPYYNMFSLKFVEPIFDRLTFSTISKAFSGIFSKSILAKKYLEDKGFYNVQTAGVGLDFDRYEKKETILPETQTLREFMKRNKCLLYVGALSKRKNYPFLLKVYEEVLQRDPNIKFVIIGKSVTPHIYMLLGKKGRYYAEKCEMKLSKKAKEGILYIESINNDQLKYIYPLAKVFLLPSVLEIFGMVLLEAMYFGAPVISSVNGGSMTLIKDKNTGIMIKDFNEKIWADTAIKLIQDDNLSNTIIRNAHSLVTKEYSWDNIAKKMINSVISNKSPHRI